MFSKTSVCSATSVSGYLKMEEKKHVRSSQHREIPSLETSKDLELKCRTLFDAHPHRILPTSDVILSEICQGDKPKRPQRLFQVN
jgi:hypothetical protein